MDTPERTVRWIKSSFSHDEGQCVELAVLGEDRIGVRDSKNPGLSVLSFTRAELATFLTGTKAGEFG